jgi:cysteine desulfuration protein SufE
MTSNLPPKLRELLDNLSLLTDRQDRIECLAQYAERFLPVTAEVASHPFEESHRVPDCESEAFVWATPLPGGKVKLHFAVENPQGVSAMALAAILDETLSGLTPEEIQTVPDDVVYAIFGRELSMGKSMGLTGVVRMVRAVARSAASATMT